MDLKVAPINTVLYKKGFFKNTCKHSINNENKHFETLSFLAFKGIAERNIQIANTMMKDKKAQETFEKMINEFAQLEEVEAIALGGSRKTNSSDKLSDIDIEIYTNGEIPVQKRYEIIKKYSSKYDVGQDYFGGCDEFYADNTGQRFDFSYFDKNWIDDVVENVWHKHQASNGYTTCFLHTIKNGEALRDKNGWLKTKKEELNTPYPKELKENIIKRNLALLKDKPFDSYYEQIKKAVSRNDYNSLNHRIAAFMASYFDIIFAMNEQLHPGEKRLVKFAQDKCTILPRNFEENINSLMINPSSDTLFILDDMIYELRKCLQ